jgi:bifunctional non-homologous end joining protein LigD
MLATLAKVPFSAQGWIYELKYDGFRCLASKVSERVCLMSRNGNDMADRFPEVVVAMAAIPADVVLDGELVICDELGCSQWSRLQKRHVIRRPDRVRAAAAADPACIFAFDLLWLNGEDYRPYPLVIRKAKLSETLKGSKRIMYASHFENSAAEVWALATKFELEGIVAKDGSSTYSAGRTTHWQKIKTEFGRHRERLRRPR